mmetsp:Transcript_839/g.2372  ORF Transcript_839/g.2372 Transcript_839/m.2372 type:complete len:222 (-) Transcript_839:156-821(-)
MVHRSHRFHHDPLRRCQVLRGRVRQGERRRRQAHLAVDLGAAVPALHELGRRPRRLRPELYAECGPLRRPRVSHPREDDSRHYFLRTGGTPAHDRRRARLRLRRDLRLRAGRHHRLTRLVRLVDHQSVRPQHATDTQHHPQPPRPHPRRLHHHHRLPRRPAPPRRRLRVSQPQSLPTDDESEDASSFVGGRRRRRTRSHRPDVVLVVVPGHRRPRRQRPWS